MIEKNFETKLHNIVQELFEAKYKQDILKDLLNLILMLNPKRNSKGSQIYMLYELDPLSALGMYNIWNSKRWLAEKMVKNAEDILLSIKAKFLELLISKYVNIDNLKFEKIMNSGPDEFENVTFFVQKTQNKQSCEYVCMIQRNGSEGKIAISF